MIYLFQTTDKGERRRLPQAYNGLTINDDTVDYDPRSATGGTAALYELNIAAIDEQWDAVTEPKVANHGMQAFQPFKINALIREDGIIRAPNLPVLMDAVRALNKAFDPVNAYTADSGIINKGFLPLTFSIPTADITNYPTGFITAEYLVRSIKRPVARTSEFEGNDCSFALYLQAADPRCYYTVAQSASRSNAGNITADNSLAGFPSWPILTFTFTGAGSARVGIRRNSTGTKLVIDATGCVSTDVLIVDMEQRTITLNGVSAISRYVSGPWVDQPVGSTTWNITNETGTLAATVATGWGRAL
jgi:hypothetical protein